MSKWSLASVGLIAAFAGLELWVGGAHSIPSATPPVPSVAAAARAVFQAKCAGCHGPDLTKPRGRFGFVLDLDRLAHSPEMVIPGRPAESELWVLVERDEMPPGDSPHGPLTPEQKEAIRAWIAAGAPALSASER